MQWRFPSSWLHSVLLGCVSGWSLPLWRSPLGVPQAWLVEVRTGSGWNFEVGKWGVSEAGTELD